MFDFNNCFYLYRSEYELEIVDNFRLVDDNKIELTLKTSDNITSNKIINKTLISNRLNPLDDKELNDLITLRSWS